MKIFDPLSVIIKLGILSKKPVGTKISIKNYILTIQEPSYLQGLIRYFNRDIKYDIEYIIYPIKIACDIYLKKNLNNKSSIKLLFRNAQNGLYLLIKSYQDYPIIIYCLKYANIIIEIYINNLIKDDLLLTYDLNLLSISNKIYSLKKSLSGNSLQNLDNNLKKKSVSNNNINEMNNSFSRSSSINNLNDIDTSNCKIKDSLLSSCTALSSPICTALSSPRCTEPDCPTLKYQNINFNEKNKLVSSPKDVCSPKNISRSSSINDLSHQSFSRQSSINDNDNIKKTILRYGATGFFVLEQDNENEKICNEIIENINKINNNNNLIIQNNINIYDNYNYQQNLLDEFNNIWTDKEISYIIKLLDNYINSDLLLIKYNIEKYMEKIDDIMVNIILNYYQNNKS